MDSSSEPKGEDFALAQLFIPEVAFAIKKEEPKVEATEEPEDSKEPKEPGQAGCPLALDPEAQLAALAPVIADG